MAMVLSAIIGSLVLALSGCSDQSGQTEKTLRVGVITYSQDDPFINALTDELKAHLKTMESEERRIIVSIKSGNDDQQEQNEKVEEMIDAGCDVLCVNLVDRTAPYRIIRMARNENIPVIFFNREPVKEDLMQWQEDAGSQWGEEETSKMRVYHCESCGGEIIADENQAATKCPYCDNPVVMKGQFQGDLRPDYVIPFKLDKAAAKERFKSHLNGKPLLPKVFRSENHIDEIKGIYVPFWLFDADAEADIRYKGTTVRTWSDSDYNYTQTSYYSILRGGRIGFERVPVDGSSKMEDDLMESIEPFDFSEAVPFQTAYLAGYMACLLYTSPSPRD